MKSIHDIASSMNEEQDSRIEESKYASRPTEETVNSTVFDKFEAMDAEFEKAARYAEKFSKQDKARKAYSKAARQLIAAINMLKI